MGPTALPLSSRRSGRQIRQDKRTKIPFRLAVRGDEIGSISEQIALLSRTGNCSYRMRVTESEV